MRTTSCFFRSYIGLLLAAVLNTAGPLVAAPVASPVTQAWAVRVEGPTNSYFEARGVSVGPSGDVFVAGHVGRFSANFDILVSRYDSSGAPMRRETSGSWLREAPARTQASILVCCTTDSAIPRASSACGSSPTRRELSTSACRLGNRFGSRPRSICKTGACSKPSKRSNCCNPAEPHSPARLNDSSA